MQYKTRGINVSVRITVKKVTPLGFPHSLNYISMTAVHNYKKLERLRYVAYRLKYKTLTNPAHMDMYYMFSDNLKNNSRYPQVRQKYKRSPKTSHGSFQLHY